MKFDLRSVAKNNADAKLDKPTPPRNLQVKNVFSDRCTLFWQPPSDDGGSPITRYVVEAIDVSQPHSSWDIIGESFNPQERDFLCLNLEERHRYKFRVIAINQLGRSLPCTLPQEIQALDPWGGYIHICGCFLCRLKQ